MTDTSNPLLQKPTESVCPSRPSRCCDYSEPTKDRDDFFDNFKGLASLCIVFLHFGGFVCTGDQFLGTSSGKLIHGGTLVVSIFAMPSFCFITGFCSSPDLNKARRTNLLRYVVVWVIQHALYFFLLGGLVGERSYTNQWQDQHPHLNATNHILMAEGKPTLSPPGPLPLHIFREWSVDWYIWCAIIWRLLLPLIDRLRNPLLLSIVISLAMMVTDSSSSVYSNAPFGFLPYFILGYQMKGKREKIDKISENKAYKVSLILFVLIVMVWSFFDLDWCDYIFAVVRVGPTCLYGGGGIPTVGQRAMPRSPTAESHFCQSGIGALLTLLFYGLSILSIFGCMTMVPKARTYLLTRAGRDAIYIYFGQLWILVLLRYVGFDLMLNNGVLPGAFGLAMGIIGSLGSWAILAQPCVKCICSPCIEPKIEDGCCAIAMP